MMKPSHPLINLGLLRVGLVLSAVLLAPGIGHAIDGAQLFGSKCLACHGPKGEGTQVGPALKGDPFIIEGTPEEIKKVIMMGRTEKEKKYRKIMNPMPSGLATEAEADALVAYLKGDLQKK
jgi:mono/diheme cytochrome c family protein